MSELKSPPWFEIAKSQLGVAELRGGENPKIIEYDATTSLRAKEDEVPWCSAFVNWCMTKAGLPGTNSAWAQSWKAYGSRLSNPVHGCIVVFSWSESNGHVTFFDSYEHGFLHCLGGNQSDEVRYTNFSSVYGTPIFIWPDKYPMHERDA